MKPKERTAMEKLLKHFIDAWSSPSDTFNPLMVIEKVESMLPEERENLIDSFDEGQDHDNGFTGVDYVNHKFGI